jgi:hypothetical protein
MGILVLLLLIFIGYGIYKAALQQSSKILSNWHQLFDKTNFSPQEFYQTVEKLIHERQFRGVSLLRITYAEGGLFSSGREYLRVRYKDYLFDICAAPFAKNFFISWWLTELGTPMFDALKRIPIIGLFMIKRPKTFFEMDTENMVRECIRDCVNIAIGRLTEEKGHRNQAAVSLATVEAK